MQYQHTHSRRLNEDNATQIQELKLAHGKEVSDLRDRIIQEQERTDKWYERYRQLREITPNSKVSTSEVEEE